MEAGCWCINNVHQLFRKPGLRLSQSKSRPEKKLDYIKRIAGKHACLLKSPIGEIQEYTIKSTWCTRAVHKVHSQVYWNTPVEYVIPKSSAWSGCCCSWSSGNNLKPACWNLLPLSHESISEMILGNKTWVHARLWVLDGICADQFHSNRENYFFMGLLRSQWACQVTKQSAFFNLWSQRDKNICVCRRQPSRKTVRKDCEPQTFVQPWCCIFLSFCFMNLDFCTPPAYVTAHETNNEGMKGRGKDDGGYNSNERWCVSEKF